MSAALFVSPPQLSLATMEPRPTPGSPWLTWRSQKQRLRKPRFSGACAPGWGTRTPPASFWGTWIGARGPSTHLPSWMEQCPELWPPCPSLVPRAGGCKTRRRSAGKNSRNYKYIIIKCISERTGPWRNLNSSFRLIPYSSCSPLWDSSTILGR